tara:strand:- start:251 stop:538 length:288 start_codon:yes stop_codon:yes gene_type:complete
MIDIDKYEGHTPGPWEVNNPDDDESLIFSVGALKFVSSANTRLIADAPLILAAYDKQVRWINDILFRLEKMEEASVSQRLRFLLTVQDELEMMIK